MVLLIKKEREEKRRVANVKGSSKILLQGCRKRMQPQSALCQNCHA